LPICLFAKERKDFTLEREKETIYLGEKEKKRKTYLVPCRYGRRRKRREKTHL